MWTNRERRRDDFNKHYRVALSAGCSERNCGSNLALDSNRVQDVFMDDDIPPSQKGNISRSILFSIYILTCAEDPGIGHEESSLWHENIRSAAFRDHGDGLCAAMWTAGT